MPLILTLRRQRQVDLCEFKANLVYIVSSRIFGATGRPCAGIEGILGYRCVAYHTSWLGEPLGMSPRHKILECIRAYS